MEIGKTWDALRVRMRRAGATGLGVGLLFAAAGCAAPGPVPAGPAVTETVVETATVVAPETAAEPPNEDVSSADVPSEDLTQDLSSPVSDATGETAALDSAAIEWTTAPLRADAERVEGMIVTDIQTIADADFESVVFELAGEGRPGYVVEFVENAIQEGSGMIYETGDAKVLLVQLTGMMMPFDTEYEEFSDSPVHVDGEIVREVIYDAWFEGEVRIFITINPDVPNPEFSVQLSPGAASLAAESTQLVVSVRAGQ